jgi:hypothetical protein
LHPTLEIKNGDQVHLSYSFADAAILMKSDGRYDNYIQTILSVGSNQGFFSMTDVSIKLKGFSGSQGVSSSYEYPVYSTGVTGLSTSVYNPLRANTFLEFAGVDVRRKQQGHS